jgi:hypothetical protein
MTNQPAQAALVRAAASFVRDTYSGEWADDAAATLETDADLIERGEPCSLLRLAEAMQPAAVSAAVTPPTQTALRDWIRRAICEAEGFAWDTDMLEPDEYGEVADAVLAVLYREWPWLRAEAEDAAPTADQAAVLADDEGDELVCVDQCGSCDACGMEPFGTPAEGWRQAAHFLRRTARESGDRAGALHGARLIEAELRRLADEAQQPSEEQAETPLEKRLRYSERRNDELRAECRRRGKIKLEQAERIIALERQVDEVQRQLGAEILRAGQAEAELRRMADETATTQTPDAVDLPTLAAALDGLHTLIATSSRDWQTYRVDAWLWAVLCGWDCEQTEHDETCTHGALEETAAMHGWDEATVAKARRYRAAVRAVTETLPTAGAGQADQPPTTQPEPDDPTQCSGEEGFCPEHGFHRHSLKQPATEARETVHACPPDGSGLTPCCGRAPFELPLGDRISSEAPVTCTGGADTARQDGAET